MRGYNSIVGTSLFQVVISARVLMSNCQRITYISNFQFLGVLVLSKRLVPCLSYLKCLSLFLPWGEAKASSINFSCSIDSQCPCFLKMTNRMRFFKK